MTTTNKTETTKPATLPRPRGTYYACFACAATGGDKWGRCSCCNGAGWTK